MRATIYLIPVLGLCVGVLMGGIFSNSYGSNKIHSPLTTSVVDTLDIYGGPGTLLGKFQTVDGSPDSQEWITSDGTEIHQEKWHVSVYKAANLDTSVSDNHAWWCGEQFPVCEADTLGGYGNSWNTSLAWLGQVGDPALPAEITVTGILNNDTEPGYDFTLLEFAIYGNEFVEVLALDGKVQGFEFAESFTYSPEDYLGDSGDVRVHLKVKTDGAWSDEDCLYPSTGACQVDNLQVTIRQDGYPDIVSPVESCEPGDPIQWENIPNPGYGNFAQLWTGLEDADPSIDNHSPQWAFIDDGIIVPGTGGSVCHSGEGCYGPNNLVVNIWGGLSGDPADLLLNHVTSPVLEFPILTGLPGYPNLRVNDLVLSADAYFHWAEYGGPYVGLEFDVLSTSDLAGLEGWQNSTLEFVFIPPGPEYQRIECEFPVQSLVPDVRWVKIQISALMVDNMLFPTESTPAPYFDNVRLQAGLVETSSSIPPLSDHNQIGIYPNPFNPQTSVTFNLAHSQHVRLAVYDVRGRLLTELTDQVFEPGEHSLDWQGKDDHGRTVPSGEYFFKAEIGDRTVIKKAMLVR